MLFKYSTKTATEKRNNKADLKSNVFTQQWSRSKTQHKTLRKLYQMSQLAFGTLAKNVPTIWPNCRFQKPFFYQLKAITLVCFRRQELALDSHKRNKFSRKTHYWIRAPLWWNLFWKGHPRPHFCFLIFKQCNFWIKLMRRNVHLSSGAGMQTNDFFIMSLLP